MPTTVERRALGALGRVWKVLCTYKRVFLVLLVPLFAGLTALAARAPWTVERVYSSGLYRVLRELFGRVFGMLPFSVAEVVIVLGVLGILFWLGWNVVRLFTRGGRRDRLHRMIASCCCAAGVGYALFVLTCGFNYHRPSFAAQSGLHVRDSSALELAALYHELAVEANLLSGRVERDADGVMRMGRSSWELAVAAPSAYEALGVEYPQFAGYTPRPKPVALSRLMSYSDITGIYIPFTFEANVNVDVVDYNIPFTMMHELAHFKGFMREDEANFIAFLACRASGDDEFRYSGTVMALRYCGNALYAADAELYWAVNEVLNDAVRADFAANSAYWKQFEGPMAEVSQAMNDAYLRANRQEDGIRSYGRMVDLLLADYRDRHDLD